VSANAGRLITGLLRHSIAEHLRRNDYGRVAMAKRVTLSDERIMNDFHDGFK
jgi:hypothetical protein